MIYEGDPKGGISRLAKMRKPQCTGVHEDFRIKRNAEITLLSRSHTFGSFRTLFLSIFQDCRQKYDFLLSLQH